MRATNEWRALTSSLSRHTWILDNDLLSDTKLSTALLITATSMMGQEAVVCLLTGTIDQSTKAPPVWYCCAGSEGFTRKEPEIDET